MVDYSYLTEGGVEALELDLLVGVVRPDERVLILVALLSFNHSFK